MKQITIFYWGCTQYPDLKYKHKEEFPYTKRKLNSIIYKIIDTGYNVQLLQSDNRITVMVDKGRFRQS